MATTNGRPPLDRVAPVLYFGWSCGRKEEMPSFLGPVCGSENDAAFVERPIFEQMYAVPVQMVEGDHYR